MILTPMWQNRAFKGKHIHPTHTHTHTHTHSLKRLVPQRNEPTHSPPNSHKHRHTLAVKCKSCGHAQCEGLPLCVDMHSVGAHPCVWTCTVWGFTPVCRGLPLCVDMHSVGAHPCVWTCTVWGFTPVCGGLPLCVDMHSVGAHPCVWGLTPVCRHAQ